MQSPQSSSNNNRPIIEPDLVMFDIEGSTPEAVLSVMSDRLFERGLVKDSFKEAVIERENNFPTGLPTVIPVAIPHTDSVHNLHSALAVAILKEPATFRIMGTDDESAPVRLVFMLTLTDPKSQAKLLGNLVELIRQPEVLEKLVSSTDSELVAENLRSQLLPESNSVDGPLLPRGKDALSMKTPEKHKAHMELNVRMQEYFGKYGGFFVPDPFTPALEVLTEDFIRLATGPDLVRAMQEAAGLIDLQAPRFDPLAVWGKTSCHLVDLRVRDMLLVGYCALAKLLGMRLACAVHSRAEALQFSKLVRGMEVTGALWLDRKLGEDETLVAELKAMGLEVDTEKTRTLFDDPEMYAFQRYISDPQKNLFLPLATNVGPAPFPAISGTFAAVSAKLMLDAMAQGEGLTAEAIICPAIPGTEMVGILRSVKDEMQLVTYERAGQSEREDCYCGAYTRVTQIGSEEYVLSPELVSAWDNGRVERIQAADAKASVESLKLAGSAIVVLEG